MRCYRQDVITDYAADLRGLKAGLASPPKDCFEECRIETKTPGPKQPKECDPEEVECCKESLTSGKYPELESLKEQLTYPATKEQKALWEQYIGLPPIEEK